MRKYHSGRAVGRAFFSLAIFVALLSAPTLTAQTTTEDKKQDIEKLERRLEQLEQEAAALRKALEAAKGSTGEAPEPTQETTEPEDLTQTELIEKPSTEPTPQPTPPPAVAPTPEPAPTPLDTELVPSTNAPAASKVFNPDISLIGNFVVRGGDQNSIEDRPTASLEETELAFEAFVDPYAKAKFFIALGEEGAEVEEGYINFITLPWDLTAKVGKFKAAFGKINTQHPHNFVWVDSPMAVDTFLGDEGLNDHGISVSRIFALPGDTLVEGTVEAFSGDVEGVFEKQAANDLFSLAHLKVYRDLTDNSNIEVGSSYARGTTPEVGGTNQFAGLDFTFRWKPLTRAIYRSLLARTEMIWNDRDDVGEKAFGFYAAADYQVARRWYVGGRFDQADVPEDPSLTDQGVSLVLTFRPSEFSTLRMQLRRTEYDGQFDANEILLQAIFSIGAHGAHTF